VSIAAFHMEDKALTWYNWIMDSGHIGGWEEFILALKVRFATSAYNDPIGAFTKLVKTSIMEAYQSKFEVLSNMIPGLSEDIRVHTFLSGLTEEVRITVNCLSAAFGLARLLEEKVSRRNNNPKVNAWTSNSNYQLNKSSYYRLPAPWFSSKPANTTFPSDTINHPTNTNSHTNRNPSTSSRKPNVPIRREC